MSTVDLLSPDGLPQTAGYSHVAAVPASARLVWTSGQVALDHTGQLVGGDSWEDQTRQVLRNLRAALEAAGAGWSDVIKLTIYVVDTAHLDEVRRARDDVIDLDRPPTSSLVQVSHLFRPDLLVEIEAVAAVAP